MISKNLIYENLKNCITDSSHINLPNFKKGKVRDQFDCGDKLILITTDRQSAFDRILASVPFKGQVLNQVSAFWFENTSHIVKNHVIEIPDPNVTVAEKCKVFPIEFVVRGYLTGSTDTSAWTQYSQGKRSICGNNIPDGMVKNQKFETPILTPTTKAQDHDESISAEQIIDKGIIKEEIWAKLEDIVLQLFQYGTDVARSHGLILVDTKYELGTDKNGDIILIDEIHTPDSSRFWISETYESRFAKNLEPENIDKEFLRLWFKDRCDPYNDPELPNAPDDLIVELSSRYITLYELITGNDFEIDTEVSINERLRDNLKKYL